MQAKLCVIDRGAPGCKAKLCIITRGAPGYEAWLVRHENHCNAT